MAQQNIDLGSFPNDPNADPIRAAFQKVQNNFTELYTTSLSTGVLQVQAGAGLSTNRIVGNVTISANIPNITIQTDSSLKVGLGVPSGNSATIYSYATPFVIGLSNSITSINANFSGNVAVSNLVVANFVGSSLLPYANVTHNLGSPSHRWKDLYLSGNTITIGTQTITTDANGIATSGNITVNGDLNVGNVAATYVGGTLTNANQPNVTGVGTLASLQVAGDLTSGNLSVSGNLSTANLSASVLQVATIQATTITGNIVTPPGGNTQAPGSDTQLLFNSGGNTAAASGVTFNQTSGLLSIVGNVSGGNLNTSGALQVGSGANITGTATIGGNIFANTGNVQSNNIISLGVISASQTITGNGIISQGILTVQGDATMGNITTVNSITGNVMVLNGNVSGVALVANGILNVTGLANMSGGLITNSSITTQDLIVNANLTTNSMVVSYGLTANNYTANVGIATANINANGTANFTGSNVNITGFLRLADANTSNINASGILNVYGSGSNSITMNNGNLTSTGTVFGLHANVSGNVYATTGTVFGQHANVSGNVYANSGTMFAIDNNLTGNLYANAGQIFSNIANISNHIIGGGNVYANSGTLFGQHSNVSGNVYANSGTVYGNIIRSLSNIITATHLTSTNGNVYATSGTLFGGHANVTGNVYANTGTLYSQHANVSGNVYAPTGTVFGQHANVTGNVYANTGFVYANSANLTGNMSATGNITGSTLVGSLFSGNGFALTKLQGAAIEGVVGNASQITGATQGNITSLPNISGFGTLITLNTLQGNLAAANFSGNHYGNGYYLSSVNASNVTGKVGTSGLADFAANVSWGNIWNRPTNISSFTNDSNYATNTYATSTYQPITSMSSYYTKTETQNYVTGRNYITANDSCAGVIGVTLQTNLGTAGYPTFAGLNVGNPGPTSGAGTGQIRATDNITAYAASDAKWKTNVRPIPNALQKAVRIGGKLFDWTEEYLSKNGGEDGYFIRKEDFGVIAQDLLAAGFNEGVRTRQDGSLAVDYEKLSALALQAVAELYEEVQKLKENK